MMCKPNLFFNNTVLPNYRTIFKIQYQQFFPQSADNVSTKYKVFCLSKMRRNQLGIKLDTEYT